MLDMIHKSLCFFINCKPVVQFVLQGSFLQTAWKLAVCVRMGTTVSIICPQSTELSSNECTEEWRANTDPKSNAMLLRPLKNDIFMKPNSPFI